MARLLSGPLKRNLSFWSPDISIFKAHNEIICASKVRTTASGIKESISNAFKKQQAMLLWDCISEILIWWTLLYLLLFACCLTYLALLFHNYFSFMWYFIRLPFFEFYAPEFAKENTSGQNIIWSTLWKAGYSKHIAIIAACEEATCFFTKGKTHKSSSCYSNIHTNLELLSDNSGK